jgi:hypothetical protein
MVDKKSPPPKGPDGPKQDPDGDAKRPRHRPQGREHQVHKEILERRWRGGPMPTPEDYQRAREEWKNLPGSIVRPPTDIAVPPADPSAQHTPDRDDSGGKT